MQVLLDLLYMGFCDANALFLFAAVPLSCSRLPDGAGWFSPSGAAHKGGRPCPFPRRTGTAPAWHSSPAFPSRPRLLQTPKVRFRLSHLFQIPRQAPPVLGRFVVLSIPHPGGEVEGNVESPHPHAVVPLLYFVFREALIAYGLHTL